MFKALRVTILLFILVLVAGVAWLTKHRALTWDHTLDVVIYPVNADKAETTRAYIAGLRTDTFQPIGTMMEDEARRYGVTQSQPVRIWLAPEVDALPPVPAQGGNTFSIMLWSCQGVVKSG